MYVCTDRKREEDADDSPQFCFDNKTKEMYADYRKTTRLVACTKYSAAE
jgi:hypothetical protein